MSWLKLICSCRIFESTTSRLLFATRTFPRLFPQSNRNLNAYLHNLIILQVPVDTGKFTTLSRISYTGKQINATQITTCRSYRIIGLQLTATNIRAKELRSSALFKTILYSILPQSTDSGTTGRRISSSPTPEKGTKLEHLGIQITFGFGQRSLCIQC